MPNMKLEDATESQRLYLRDAARSAREAFGYISGARLALSAARFAAGDIATNRKIDNLIAQADSCGSDIAKLVAAIYERLGESILVYEEELFDAWRTKYRADDR